MSLSGLLDISRRALTVQTAAIRTIGDNIANVNTPGYSRRRAELTSVSGQSSSANQSGSGVQIKTISRVVDNFINSESQVRTSERAMVEIRQEFLQRAESPFSLDNEPGRIGYQMTAFFSALEDLRTNPADIPLRTQVIEKGEELTNSIVQTYQQIASLQREADDRIGVLLNDVNRMSSDIAAINFQILDAEGGRNQEALSLRDQRDLLLKQLSEIVSFDTVENSDGTISVYLNNGFALVNNTNARALEFTTTPEFGTSDAWPPGLDGKALGHIVYNYAADGAAAQHGDLTNVIRSGTGELAGLLSLRGVQSTSDDTAFDAQGDLVDLGTRIEYMARDLLTRFNKEYLGPDADADPAVLTPTSRDLDGHAPGPFGLFSFDGAAAADAGVNQIPELTDLDALMASGEYPNFASRLVFGVTSERGFAAARGGANAATGDASNVAGLLTLRDDLQTYNDLGAVSVNSSLEDLYGLTVAQAGGLSARAQDDYKVYREREKQVEELQSSISGVNLDEEFASLINYQRGFEASARIVRVTDELFQQILALLG